MKIKILLLLVILFLNIFASSAVLANPTDEITKNNTTDSINNRNWDDGLIISNSKDDIPKKIVENTLSKSENSYQSQPKSKSQILLDVIVDSPKVVNYDGTVLITGVLQDGVGTKWVGVDVQLFIDTDNTGPVVQTFTTLDPTGEFTFSVSFVYGDIGDHTYEVYFPNSENDVFKIAGTVSTGTITVRDKVNPTFISDAATVGKLSPITVTYSLLDDIGGNVDPSSVKGVFMDFTLTANPSGNLVNAASISTVNTTLAFDAAGEIIFTYKSPDGIDDYTLTVTATLSSSVDTSSSALKYYDLVSGSEVASVDIIVAINVGFTSTVQIGGAGFISTNNYLRNNDLIQIDGQLDNFGQPIAINNKAYSVDIVGGGFNEAFNPVDSGVTDVLGQLQYTTLLSKSSFPNPNIDIVITITFTDANVEPKSISTTIKLLIILGSINPSTSQANNGTHITGKTYWKGTTETIPVSGDVRDDDGVLITGININININTKDYPNIYDMTGQSNIIVYTVLAADGTFSYNVPIPNTGFDIQYLTLNFTIVDDAKRIQPVIPVSDELVSFTYFRTLIREVGQTAIGKYQTIPVGTSPSYVYFNETFNSLILGNSSKVYNITVYDEFNRVPIGISLYGLLSIIDDTGATVGSLAAYTKTTDGIDGILFFKVEDFKLINNYNIYLNRDSYKFRITLKIAENNADMSTTVYTQEFKLYGADEVAPKIKSSKTSYQADSEDDILITVELDYAYSAFDNIRNVSLYYRYSDNLVGDYNSAIFSSNYTLVNMDLYLALQNYNYSITFNGHGRWVQWYIVVYDLAGYGLDQNGDTHVADDRGWKIGKAFTDTDGSSGTPNFNKMGDTDIFEIVINDAVKINGVDLISSSNVTKDDMILVSVDLPVDPSNYTNVLVYYQIILYNPDTGEEINRTALVFVSMNVNITFTTLGTDYIRYVYLFNTTAIGMDWFTQLDYKFNYTDFAGNSYESEFISTLFDSAPDQIQQTWVNDEVDPVGNFNQTGFDDSLSNSTLVNPNEYDVYNTTSNIYIMYNVTDGFGSGIKNVNVTIWQIINTTDGLVYYAIENISMVLDGNIVYIFNQTTLSLNEVVGEFYLVEFYINDNYMISNTSVSWTIYVMDNANRLTVLNDIKNNDGSAVKLNIVDPPKVLIPTNDDISGSLTTIEIVTTDENGNTITTQIVVEVNEGRNSAYWIVVGFISGLVLLIAYYQRHNILDILERRRRSKLAESTLSDLMIEIDRLKAEGKYKLAVERIWDGLERAGREITETPRKFNQTVSEYSLYLSRITGSSDIGDENLAVTLKIISTVYESVRYGKDTPSVDEIGEAVDALKIVISAMIRFGNRAKYDEDDDF